MCLTGLHCIPEAQFYCGFEPVKSMACLYNVCLHMCTVASVDPDITGIL